MLVAFSVAPSGTGHADGSVRSEVDAGTVVRFGAMLAQPMPNVSDWPRAAEEQRAIFLRGISPDTGE